jgi:hypothetical protein
MTTVFSAKYAAREYPKDPFMTSQNPLWASGDAVRALTRLGRIGSRRLVFDSGLISLDDPGIVALPESYDDLTRIFRRGERPGA